MWVRLFVRCLSSFEADVRPIEIRVDRGDAAPSDTGSAEHRQEASKHLYFTRISPSAKRHHTIKNVARRHSVLGHCALHKTAHGPVYCLCEDRLRILLCKLIPVSSGTRNLVVVCVWFVHPAIITERKAWSSCRAIPWMRLEVERSATAGVANGTIGEKRTCTRYDGYLGMR